MVTAIAFSLVTFLVSEVAGSECSYNNTEAGFEEAGLETWDIVTIALYFVFILAVGIWAMYTADRGNVAGFFLAGRDMTWFPVGASLYSSNIGSGHFVGLAGTGAASGIAQGSFEWNAMVTLLFLGWIFAPVYIAGGVVTMPEYLAKRFGGERIQPFLSILSLFMYVFTKISADLFAGALFITEALGWGLYPSVIGLLAITALYTVTGGLKAVIYTDTAQTVIMLIGAFIMMILSFQEIGGYENLEPCYMEAIPSIIPENTTCGCPREDAFHVFRDAKTSDLPWPGMLFGITIIATWYWCTDQVIVQRTLAAKNLSHAKGGCVFAGLLKFTPMYMMVMVGMISRIVYPNSVACADPAVCTEACGNPGGCSNYAYAKLVLYIMPQGLKGLLLAVMIAALMSSLTSVFNSASTLFTCDLWTKIRPEAKTRELMIVGRIFILIMIVVSILWIPIVQAAASGRLFDYIQAITSFLAPPITAVFVLAVFWQRMNEPGAFWGLVLGMFIGLCRMCMEFGVGAPNCPDPDFRPFILTKVHYLHFGMLLFGLSVMISVIVSYLTPPIPKEYIVRLTWSTRHSKRKRKDIEELELKTKPNLRGQDNPALDMSDDKRDDASSVSSSEQSTAEPVSGWRKAFNTFCGLQEDKAPTLTSEEQEMLNKKMADITEEKWPAIIVNTGALFMLSAGVFLFGFYA
ncbi:sodium/glucose cotransporter 4-like [Styela clava]